MKWQQRSSYHRKNWQWIGIEGIRCELTAWGEFGVWLKLSSWSGVISCQLDQILIMKSWCGVIAQWISWRSRERSRKLWEERFFYVIFCIQYYQHSTIFFGQRDRCEMKSTPPTILKRYLGTNNFLDVFWDVIWNVRNIMRNFVRKISRNDFFVTVHGCVT